MLTRDAAETGHGTTVTPTSHIPGRVVTLPGPHRPPFRPGIQRIGGAWVVSRNCSGIGQLLCQKRPTGLFVGGVHWR